MHTPQTILSIEGSRFLINGRPTYAGCGQVEGLLFNLRAVNATFDDTLGKVDWWDDDGSHPENGYAGYGPWRSPASAFANTERFVAALPEYRAHGILAVNLNFQGGQPLRSKRSIAAGRTSAGAGPNGHRDHYYNSGFNADGSIDPLYGQRLAGVIEACDRLGMAIILQLFYFGQGTALPGEAEVLAAADQAVDWVCGRGYRNVMIEIANEVMAVHYHHAILKPGRIAELIQRVRARALERHGQRLPVMTSEGGLLNPAQWTPAEIDAVMAACDLLALHGGDNIESGMVGDTSIVVNKVEYLRSRPWFQAQPRPILTNETQVRASFEALLQRGASFGLHSSRYLQTMWPPRWGVWDNDIAWFFRRVRELTVA